MERKEGRNGEKREERKERRRERQTEGEGMGGPSLVWPCATAMGIGSP